MKIIEHYIVKYHSEDTMLYKCEDGTWFINKHQQSTSDFCDGIFHLEKITNAKAVSLIEKHEV